MCQEGVAAAVAADCNSLSKAETWCSERVAAATIGTDEQGNRPNSDGSVSEKRETNEGASVSPSRATKSIPEDLRTFQLRRNSLRVSAHRISALAGYHPYADLPRILFDLVYQGPKGRALLRADAELLGLDVRDDEEVLEDLATKGGAECLHILREAREIKSGRKVVGTVTEAADIKTNAAGAASVAKSKGKLTKEEVRKLEEGIRSTIDTGFGTNHEGEALDRYEKVCGWEVRERNAEVREWKFLRAEDCGDGLTPDDVLVGSQSVPTVRPMGPALSLNSRKEGKSPSDSSVCAVENVDNMRNNASTSAGADRTISEQNSVGNNIGDVEPTLAAVAEGARGQNAHEEADPTNFASSKDSGEGMVVSAGNFEQLMECRRRKRPFFSIRGAVDGIRDELYFDRKAQASSTACKKADEFDDGMAFREVVVECKHRMKRAMEPPPLYDQIQAVAYCLMYGTDAAEIVQVVRKKRQRIPEDSVKEGTVDKKGPEKNAEYVDKEKVNDSMGEAAGHSKGIFRYFGHGKGGVLETKALSADKENVMNSPMQETKKSDVLTHDGVANAPQNDLAGGNDKASPKQDMSVCKDSHTVSQGSAEIRKPVLVSDTTAPSDQNAASAKTDIDITVSRISLDDPCMSHRQNWRDIILPRLRSFVDAAYDVRANDGLRYQLLVSLAGATAANVNGEILDSEQTAWKMLFDLCPWAVDCDTSYNFRWGRPHRSR